MGLPGSFAFSFFRGANSDVATQKTARIGRSSIRQKKRNVLKPPPSFQAVYPGIRTSNEMSSELENESEPLLSAGSGAFAMAGDCCCPKISFSTRKTRAQWLPRGCVPAINYLIVLTLVVLTPQSNAASVGEGAGGVSIHSKLSPASDFPILMALVNFARSCGCNVEGCGAQVPSRDGELARTR